MQPYVDHTIIWLGWVPSVCERQKDVKLDIQ